MTQLPPLYTIIDLGSNSFHMLTVAKTDDGFAVVSKHKRKVRLASGLDAQNNLDQLTMNAGWDCLQYFRNILDTIQPIDIIITATAALRLAKNNRLFLQKAEVILKHPINLISGIEEAQTIYRGCAFTEKTEKPLLIIDIGGASTELVIGAGEKIYLAESLEMGCVTWLNHYFPNGKITKDSFQQAISRAKLVIEPITQKYKAQGWELCMGASGSIQAVSEISNEMSATQKMEPLINLDFLYLIQQRCIECKTISNLTITGLKASRIPVFVSGLAILIALFETLAIESVKKSNGALREGLISLLFARTK
jgi:exopolyphosphatase/guanosine-5'-triphosphate,3'-diphosphate pyrophosphatase